MMGEERADWFAAEEEGPDQPRVLLGERGVDRLMGATRREGGF